MATPTETLLIMVCGAALICGLVWGIGALYRLSERTTSKYLAVAIGLFLIACYFAPKIFISISMAMR